MLKMEPGRKYRFTLQSERIVVIVIHGTKLTADGSIEFDISVDGARNDYADINAALGDAYIKVERL